MTNRRMFFTMLWGAVFRRRSRAIMAVVASLVGAATLFCLAAVCLAVPQQMNEEMRAYGANLIVTPSASAAAASNSGSSSSETASDASSSSGINAETADAVTQLIKGSYSAKSASYRYESVRINSAPYTLAGIDVAAVKTLNQHWSVDGDWPSAGNVMVGRDVADALGVTIGSTIKIAYRSDADAASDNSGNTTSGGTSDSASDDMSNMSGMSHDMSGMSGMSHGNSSSGSSSSSGTASSGSTSSDSIAGQSRDGRVSTDILETGGTAFRVAGIVDTGGSEDEIVYAVESDVDTLAGGKRGADVIEYSVNAVGDELTTLVDSINKNPNSGVTAQQVTKITSSDTRIITMLQTLFWIVSLVVLVLTLVGVGTTISSIVSQRRNEIGLRKALGASSRAIGVEFYVESALYGLCGGLVGTAIGYALARVLCVSVFDRAIGFNWWLGLASVVLSTLIAVTASVPPVRRATRIDPAVVLREE